MTIETRAAFARRVGKNRSWVTRAAQSGRLVLTDGGQVDVEASLARLEATRGNRFDVEERWAARRAASETTPAPESAEDLNGLGTDEIGRRTRLAQMRKEEAEADKRRMELAELTGALVRRDEVERALASAVAVILGQIENMPDRIAPQVHGVEQMERVRARIKDEMEGLCRRVSDELGRLAEEPKRNAA